MVETRRFRAMGKLNSGLVQPPTVVDGLLVDHRVDGDGGLANLAVTDDELALPAANGHEGVDGLDVAVQVAFDESKGLKPGDRVSGAG